MGTRRMYEGVEYECLQSHVTQADWTPDVVPALWAVIEPETPTTPEWTRGCDVQSRRRSDVSGRELSVSSGAHEPGRLGAKRGAGALAADVEQETEKSPDRDGRGFFVGGDFSECQKMSRKTIDICIQIVYHVHDGERRNEHEENNDENLPALPDRTH